MKARLLKDLGDGLSVGDTFDVTVRGLDSGCLELLVAEDHQIVASLEYFALEYILDDWLLELPVNQVSD